MTPTPILVDRRNFDQIAPRIIDEVRGADFVGFDIETHDANKHDGLKRRKDLVFDLRRTVLCGFSLYPAEGEHSYYVNVRHADGENNVPFHEARALLDAKPAENTWICHNAAFEIANMKATEGFDVDPYVCTMQMAVSAYSPDQYDITKFNRTTLKNFEPIMRDVDLACQRFDPNLPMRQDDAETLQKIIGKTSTAKHSYNGWVDDIAYGYGLKKIVKSFFNYEMTTFKEVLGTHAHMGELTGEQVVAYGADDAYWALRVFNHLLAMMPPQTLQVFMTQENPMVKVFADLWLKGMRINVEALGEKAVEQEALRAQVLRDLKAEVARFLPFKPEPAKSLAEEKWYKDGKHVRYRQKLIDWIDNPNDEEINLTHYMTQRTMLYDLCGAKVVKAQGKVASDGEARGKIKDRNPEVAPVIDRMNRLATVTQGINLYLTPYQDLMDPDTGRMYPQVSSMLATRRMAAKYPNPMQLAKRGETTWVRRFFLPDEEDHLFVAEDWSGVELVMIGELSQDPAFFEAYGQVPHADLHGRASAALLRVETGRDVTADDFKRLKNMSEEEAIEVFTDKVLRDKAGQPLTPAEAYKYHRSTEGGKGANFNYWFSGALSTIAERRGWTSEAMWKAVEAYRAEFPVAEKWRTDTIATAQGRGYVELPDGHRRYRYEATPAWKQAFLAKWPAAMLKHPDGDGKGLNPFLELICKRIQSRARNQGVNAMIQGSCAALAKRAILKMEEEIKRRGWSGKARFVMPIHDELIYSVHRSIVVPFLEVMHKTMCDQPELVKYVKLDGAPSIGRTLHPKDQIELNEAPAIPELGIKEGDRLTPEQIQSVVVWCLKPAIYA